MKYKLNRFSFGCCSLGRKLMFAFQLMYIFPFLVCLYLVLNYILPKFGYKINLIALVVISVFIALAGVLIIKKVFDRLALAAKEAKLIVAGDINRKLTVVPGDEVGVLADALNQLTWRIRVNMDELKQYKEQVNGLKAENQKRSLIFSNLIKISSLIAQGSEFIDLLRMIVESTRLLAGSETAFLLSKKVNSDSLEMIISDGAGADYLMSVNVSAHEDIYNKALNLNKLLILDKQNLLSDNLTVAFLEKFQLKNCLAMPVFLRGGVKAVLGIGNMRESFLYSKNDIELLNIFSKQIAIVIEKDSLSRHHEAI
ncbi:MAG: GAF domain-containing protein [Candidatus Omnitrophica bacterium]|nr:GAF domain-containing protein [Candidatus Omnitrophota bacterium]MBU1923815.1 GAF domain-containing protein [Candidatus Omnitrophota bacterium]